jgi:hypothetical protein
MTEQIRYVVNKQHRQADSDSETDVDQVELPERGTKPGGGGETEAYPTPAKEGRSGAVARMRGNPGHVTCLPATRRSSLASS